MAGVVDLRFLREDMDDSRVCQQKPYPCTAEYYTFTPDEAAWCRPESA